LPPSSPEILHVELTFSRTALGSDLGRNGRDASVGVSGRAPRFAACTLRRAAPYGPHEPYRRPSALGGRGPDLPAEPWFQPSINLQIKEDAPNLRAAFFRTDGVWPPPQTLADPGSSPLGSAGAYVQDRRLRAGAPRSQRQNSLTARYGWAVCPSTSGRTTTLWERPCSVRSREPGPSANECRSWSRDQTGGFPADRSGPRIRRVCEKLQNGRKWRIIG
jgi:hypothetical protein